MSTAQLELADWQPHRTYLIPTGKRRRRCMIFERNPFWDGTLRKKATARSEDPDESQDAADSIPEGDIHEARRYVDAILADGEGIISLELYEYVEEGIVAGRILSLGLPAHVRAESVRRRFSDFCPRRPRKQV